MVMDEHDDGVKENSEYDQGSIQSAKTIESLQIRNQSATSVDHKTYGSEKHRTPTSGPWKFNLGKDLDGGTIALLPNEKILDTWQYVSSSMSLEEWAATFCSFGFYYFFTRILLQRKRHYTLHVTNKNIIVKEEMMETQFFVSHILMENQASFPISTLAYVMAEEVGTRLNGWFPASVVLEMRFGRYPRDSEVPLTIYKSLLAIFFEPFSVAAAYAFKNAFGIDFNKNPIELSMQIIAAIPLMSSPFNWMVWGAYFGLSLLSQLKEWLKKMILLAILDPSVGPRQAIGKYDACSFRLQVDVSEDANCRLQMRSILKHITKNLPDVDVIRPSLRSRLSAPLDHVVEGGAPKQVNDETHSKGNVAFHSFTVLDDYLYLSPEEMVYDVCADNPRMTSGDMKRVVFSLGAYYITDLVGHLAHKKNMLFTNKRCIQHSVLINSSNKQVDHSRLDYWVVDKITNMTVVDFKKRTTFRATSEHFGWASFEMKNRTRDFMMFMIRSMFRPRHEPARTPGLSILPKEDWRADPLHKDSYYTAGALTETETIDTAVHSEQILATCLSHLLTCFCLRVPRITLTCTDECIYIEQYSAPWCASRSRVFVVIPWCDVDGVYWQNFDASGPDCCMSYMLSCICPGLFGCYGCCCCCCSPEGAVQNTQRYIDEHHGYKGSQVGICTRGMHTFQLGLIIPNRFYGVQDGHINSVVDSITFRSVQHDVVQKKIGDDVVYSSVDGVQAQYGGSGKNLVAFQKNIANSSAKMYSDQHKGRNPMQAEVVVAQPIADDGSVAVPHCKSYYSDASRTPSDKRHRFPMTFDMEHGMHKLVPGERLLKKWRVETTTLEWWQILLGLLTFGLSFLFNRLFNQYRRFYNVAVTTERVLVTEEVFDLRMFVVTRIMENQACFKLSDLSFISSQEVGPQWCGCIPPLTAVEIRFGRYPKVTQLPKSLDAGLPSEGDQSVFMIAWCEALFIVYGIVFEGTPAALMEQNLNRELDFRSFIGKVVDCISFVVCFLRCLAREIFHLVMEFFRNELNSVGKQMRNGTRDSRSFHFLFKTQNAQDLSAELVQVLTELVTAKQDALQPLNSDIPQLNKSRYTLCQKEGEAVPVNSTGTYGKDGGFNVLERIWRLMSDEKVYDVVPDNVAVTCLDIIRCVQTLGLYYCFVLRKRLQYKRSFMLTSRRLVSHTMRVTSGVVRYSNLNLWFLAPISSYTVLKELTGTCCKAQQVGFVTDSTRFGTLQFSLKSEQFMKNFLKVVGSTRKSFNSPGRTIMSRADFMSHAELANAEYTNTFMSEVENIDVAVGSKLPPSCFKRLCCKQGTTFALTCTNEAVYIEAYTNKRRIFACLPWKVINGVYWSNFQLHSLLCAWRNSPNYMYPLHGYQGSQVRFNIKGSRNNAAGIVLPARFYGAADSGVDALVDTLSYRLRLEKQNGESDEEDRA